MTRIGRWLREPVKTRDDDIDWAAFGRSFGRWTGGYLDPGGPDPVSWKNGRRVAGNDTNTPRWAVVFGVAIGAGISGGCIGLILWLATR